MATSFSDLDDRDTNARQTNDRQAITRQNRRYLLTISGCVAICALLAASYFVL